jgi:hypothetical protein
MNHGSSDLLVGFENLCNSGKCVCGNIRIADEPVWNEARRGPKFDFLPMENSMNHIELRRHPLCHVAVPAGP